MDYQAVRIKLIERGLLVKDLARLARVDYDRLQKILHGYRSPRRDEIAAIAAVLEVPETMIAGE